MRQRAVAIVSGGMDSTVLAYLLADKGYALHLLSFDYGQRHAKELTYASRTAARLGARHDIIDLTSLNVLLHGSALTSADIEVPDGHYAEDTMKQTVVPNRNAIMLSIACGAAVADGAQMLATGVHSGDHYIYPDCRPEFVDSIEATFLTGMEGFIDPDFQVYAPFLYKTKADIAQYGAQLAVPWEDTWSCYKGGDVHCGSCGTCYERREAFAIADVADPTEYLATPEYANPLEARA